MQVASFVVQVVQRPVDVTGAENARSQVPASPAAAVLASAHATGAKVAELQSQQKFGAVSVPVTDQPSCVSAPEAMIEASPPAAATDYMGSLDAKDQQGAGVTKVLPHQLAFADNVIEKADMALSTTVLEMQCISEGSALQVVLLSMMVCLELTSMSSTRWPLLVVMIAHTFTVYL